MRKDRGQKEPISQVMFPGSVCYARNVAKHNGREVNLLPSVQEVNKALVHSIRKIAALTSRNDILDDQPKEQLVEGSHFPFLDGPRSL